MESVSTTTRPARAGEENGKDYYFVSEDEFLRMERKNEFYESVEFNGNRYGISKKEIDSKIRESRLVLVAEPVGIIEVISKYIAGPISTIYLHLDPKSCLERMLQRGDKRETAEARAIHDAGYFNRLYKAIMWDFSFTNYSSEFTAKEIISRLE